MLIEKLKEKLREIKDVDGVLKAHWYIDKLLQSKLGEVRGE